MKFNSKNILALVLFVLAFFSRNFIIFVVEKNFPKRYVNPDLLFNMFPHYNVGLEYISDIILIIFVILFIYFYLIPNIQKIRSIANQISIMFILRGLTAVLTPLMRPTGVDFPSHGLLRNQILQLGMFPSGHAGLAALMYFMIDRKKYPLLKDILLVLLVAESFLLVISRGHYSIDVVGGILLSYMIVNECKKYEILN